LGEEDAVSMDTQKKDKTQAKARTAKPTGIGGKNSVVKGMVPYRGIAPITEEKASPEK
jgi:hypothetical protein